MNDADGILIVIPARGGSKRLPFKNVLPLVGKPLICWTIEAALNTCLNARIMVSSDDKEILSIASLYADKGLIAHKRPAVLATDHANTANVLLDALDAVLQSGCSVKTMILLQPTSPLRSAEDIRASLEQYEHSEGDDTVVSVCEVDHPTTWIGTISESGYLNGLELTDNRSQDYQREYRLNGAVYVISAKNLRETGRLFTDNLRAYVMPRERSIDIDDKVDFMICESFILGKKHHSKKL